MTIEEAIQHCKETAMENRRSALEFASGYVYDAARNCQECAAEHEQLAEWLSELKQRREAEISSPPKSNAGLYDLLSNMNASFMIGKPQCVLEAITGANMICKHESCNHCIAEWLKQEVSEDATD